MSQVYRAYVTRASEIDDGEDNAPLISKVPTSSAPRPPHHSLPLLTAPYRSLPLLTAPYQVEPTRHSGYHQMCSLDEAAKAQKERLCAWCRVID